VGLAVVAWRQGRVQAGPGRTHERTTPHATPTPPFDPWRDHRTDTQKYVM